MSKGKVAAIVGELGTGKTTFIKKFAKKCKQTLYSFNIKSRISKKQNTDKVVDLKMDGLQGLKFLYYMYSDKKQLYLSRKYIKFQKILREYVKTKSKINIKTINFLKNNDILNKYINKQIDYSSHWVIDKRKY